MEENNKKEEVVAKYKDQSLFVFAVVILLAYVVGQAIFTESSFYGDVFTYSIISMICGFLIGTITYEIGKLLFGLIAGYRLVYINLFGLHFSKDNNNKTKFSFKKVDGYGGKLLMAPRKEKTVPYLYHLGGLFVMIIFVVIFQLVGHYYSSIYVYEALFVANIISAVYGLLCIINLAPFYMDNINDGFAIRLMSQDKKNKDIYNKVLLQKEAIITGKSELSLCENAPIDNPLFASTLLHNAYYYLDKDDINKCLEIVELGLKNLDYLTASEAGKLYAIKLYTYFYTNKNNDEIVDEFNAQDKSIRKVVLGTRDFETLKTGLLVAALVESNYDLYENMCNVIDSLADKYYSKTRKNVEMNMIEKSLKLISEKKRDWFEVDDNDPFEEEEE